MKEIQDLLNHLTSQGISVKEEVRSDRNEVILIMWDRKTDYIIKHIVDRHAAMQHKGTTLAVLRHMKKQLQYKREEVMGTHGWDSLNITMGLAAGTIAGIKFGKSAVVPNWIDESVAPYISKYDNHWQTLSYTSKSAEEYRTKFMRLGNEYYLPEGQSFEEPLDALRINLARWLKK